MILSNQYLKDTTIIFNTREDMLKDCHLTNCTLISHYHVLSVVMTVIDEAKSQSFKRLGKPKTTKGIIMGCYLRDCMLPDAFYDESNHFRDPQSSTGSANK